MNMKAESKVVALFENHLQAEDAVRRLQRAAFDMKKLSVIGKDYHTEEHVVGYVNTGERMRYWGKFGAFWGTLWGLLFGSAMLMLPGIGHLIILGPFASALFNALGGAALGGGAGALAGALASIGIPKDSVLKYESAIKAGKFALIAHGTAEEAQAAKKILMGTPALQVDEHAAHSVPA